MNTFCKAALFAGALGLAASTAQANCQEYLEGSRFTMLVPYAAGGGFDTYARAFAPVFEEATGAKMIVANLPAGNGSVALSQIANADADARILGLFGSGVPLESPSLDPAAFVPLTGLKLEQDSWVGRPDMAFEDLFSAPVVSGGSGLTGSLVNSGLAALAMGVDMSIVPGYDGTGSMNAAILRREIDLDSRSITSALRAQESGDFRILVTMTRSPVEGLNVPALGDVVVERSAGLSPEEQQKRATYADVVVGLGTSMRAIWMGDKVVGDTRTCLVDTVTEIVMSDAYIAAAGAMKRPVEPVPHERAKEIYADFVEATALSLPLLEDIRPLFE